MKRIQKHSDQTGRIVKEFHVTSRAYHLEEEPHGTPSAEKPGPESFDQCQSKTIDRIKAEVEQAAYQRGYERAERDHENNYRHQDQDNAHRYSELERRLKALKKDLLAVLITASQSGIINQNYEIENPSFRSEFMSSEKQEPSLVLEGPSLSGDVPATHEVL